MTDREIVEWAAYRPLDPSAPGGLSEFLAACARLGAPIEPSPPFTVVVPTFRSWARDWLKKN